MSDGIPDDLIDAMTAVLERMQVKQVEHRVRILESKENRISNLAYLCWSKGDLKFYLCENPVYKEAMRIKAEKPDLYEQLTLLNEVGRFNGYAQFPSMPLIAPGYRGIAVYVPVHGGITYFQDWWDGSVTYGFDTAHACSGESIEIISDIGWMMAETESMARGIQIAARFERYYLNANTNERKAVVLDRMGKFLPMDEPNTSVLLNLLAGEL
jgi:hypothetical protein